MGALAFSTGLLVESEVAKGAGAEGTDTILRVSGKKKANKAATTPMKKKPLANDFILQIHGYTAVPNTMILYRWKKCVRKSTLRKCAQKRKIHTQKHYKMRVKKARLGGLRRIHWASRAEKPDPGLEPGISTCTPGDQAAEPLESS